MQALLLVTEHDGPTMFAQVGVMRASSSVCSTPTGKSSIGVGAGARPMREACDDVFRFCSNTSA